MMGGYGAGMMGGYGSGTMGASGMSELHAAQCKLRELYDADDPDANAIADQQKKVDDLRRTMIKSHLDARNQVAAFSRRSSANGGAPWGDAGSQTRTS